jgi:hypothetical protein
VSAHQLLELYAIVALAFGSVGTVSALAGLLALATWARAGGRGLEGIGGD